MLPVVTDVDEMVRSDWRKSKDVEKSVTPEVLQQLLLLLVLISMVSILWNLTAVVQTAPQTIMQ